MTALLAIPEPRLQPIDWTIIKDAIFDLIVARLGLDESRVIWENQNIPQPDYPYVSMLKIAGPTSEIDGRAERRVSTDLSLVGEEAGLLTYKPVVFTISFSAHVDEESGANDPHCDAEFFMSKLQAVLDLQSVHDTLKQSGFAVVRDAGVLPTSLVINGVWLSRATLDVIFRTASVIDERNTIIEQVEITPPDPGKTVIVDGT